MRVAKCLGFSLLIFCVILIIAAYTRHSDDNSTPTVYAVRLPLAVSPTQYTMALTASLAKETFGGEMLIDLYFASTTTQILFHQKNLQLDSFWVTTDGGATKIEPTVAQDTGQFDLYVLQFNHNFPAHSIAQLHISFSGTLEHSLAGFYLSSYTTAAGASRTIASTQFESTDARRAFPCFDEPAFKANWTISITTEATLDGQSMNVLSNMPTIGAPVPVDGGMQRWSFETSVRMSTYLVAYVISDFTFRETNTARGLPIRVWTAPDKINSCTVALNAAKVSIEAYEAFYGVLYPLPKQDMVAIPNFPVGAMENCQSSEMHRVDSSR